jgi:hypothetical protein
MNQLLVRPWALGACFTVGCLLALVAGCADGRPTIMPNPDSALNKTSAQFAADAVARHPYKFDAPSGGEAIARAQVGYSMNRLEVINLSNDTWNNVEIWVNKKYVVFVPKMEPKVLKRLPFEMLFDDKGNYFPTDNSKILINDVTMLRDGKMYTIPLQLAD